MRLLTILAPLLACLVCCAEDGAVRLDNDAPYQSKLESAIAAEPLVGAKLAERYRWLCDVALAAFPARRYDLAERYLRAALAIAPSVGWLRSNLSVSLGKQGRYAEALQEADLAMLIDPAAKPHASSVRCSWLLLLGRRDEAMAAWTSIQEPTEVAEQVMHHGCGACFFASAGDEAKVEAEMKRVLELDATHRDFFLRDVVFDPFRGKPWFIALVGETLASP